MEKIFGLGLGRTGTTTLQWMLENLGFNAGHFVPHVADYDQWDAVLDAPTFMYALSINARYPNALFINTMRDEDSWLKSIEAWFHDNPAPRMSPEGRNLRMAVYGCLSYNENILRTVHADHVDLVKWFEQTLAPGRVLHLELCNKGIDDKTKWDKLCRFLGKRSPNIPIPQLNVKQMKPPGWRMRESAIAWIRTNIPAGKTILELGSGDGTTQSLFADYKLYSVEHDMRWTNKYPSRYIYIPLTSNGWYDAKMLKSRMPADYDMLIVDGPPSSEQRLNFIKYVDMFKPNVPIMFDDIERDAEKKVLEHLIRLGYKIIASEQEFTVKQWAVVSGL